MDDIMKEKAISRFQKAWLQTSKLYNDMALLLNSCDIAKLRYMDMKNDSILNTVQNMPEEFKLSKETGIETTFTKENLILEYKANLLNEIYLNYLVRAISIMDACFEDIYEELLPVFLKELEEEKLEKLVINAWANDRLRKFFVNDLKLKKLDGKFSTADMIFDRYEELRIIRHAVIHNQGKLSGHQKNKLEELSKKLPPDKIEGSFANQEFIRTGTVKITWVEVFLLRKWLYEVISFFIEMFKIS